MKDYVLVSFWVNVVCLIINSLALVMGSDGSKVGVRTFTVLSGVFWVGWAYVLLFFK